VSNAVDTPAAVPAEQARVIARGIVSAVRDGDHLTAVQSGLLSAVFESQFDLDVDADQLEPIDESEMVEEMSALDDEARRRVVQLMVLGELVLRPIPPEVARRVASYADALAVDDQFVRIARRYAQGGFGLAWIDLHQSGFVEHWELACTNQLKTTVKLEHQLAAGVEDAPLAEAWSAFRDLAPGSLGREVWNMYRGRGFGLPGTTGGASAYLAQHDFVHVLADYGTNLKGEFEVFSLIGRADPDPKGFAWIATLVGLFETGYVADAGFFTGDLVEPRLVEAEMHVRIADALYRGRVLRDRLGVDLLEVDYHEHAHRPIADICADLGLVPKSDRAVEAGSPGAFDLEGMSMNQQAHAASLDDGGS
jgi:hypothetical protein